MKLAAHPMVVAVALGLLPPSMLDVRGLEPQSSDADDDKLSLTDEDAWASVPAPSAEALRESAARYEQVSVEVTMHEPGLLSLV